MTGDGQSLHLQEDSMSKTGTRCVFRIRNTDGEVLDVPARRVGEDKRAFEAESKQILTPFDPREISLVEIDTGGRIAHFKLGRPDEDEVGPVFVSMRDDRRLYWLEFSSSVDGGKRVALRHVSIFPNPPEDDEEDDD
jgi:hypothetical protein